MATERCQLPNTVESDRSDEEGVLWDTGLPLECRICLNRALVSKNAKTMYFEPQVFEDEDEDQLDTYVADGIRRTNDTAERFGIQECGIDDEGVNEGSLYYRTEVTFSCPKN